MNTYLSIASPSEGYFEDKGSKFLSYSFSVHSEEDIKTALEKVKELHPKATHHCYAYRLGIDKNNYRANDDGEPSGSAGRPILGQIDSFKLSNVLNVVVRYYGGTNLGVSGLINAYKKSTQDSFNNAMILEFDLLENWSIVCDFTEINHLFNYLKKIGVNSWEEHYSEECKINISIPLSKTNSLSSWLENQNMKFKILSK